MIIDRGHRTWIAATLVLLVLSTALYVWYAQSVPGGPTGGSWQGLAFGIVGSLLMVFAGLLSGRKKVPRLPIGSAQTWLKGHIWLGLLSVPLILFHAGFHVGGMVEQLLLLVFAIVIVSGIFGLALQHYLPRVMKTELPAETMYNQPANVCRRLAETGDELLQSACGLLATDDGEEDSNSQTLQQFYLKTVRSFFVDQGVENHSLYNPSRAEAMFAQVRGMVPPQHQSQLEQIEALCEERRQLATQVNLRAWMHGWLIIHLPLSVTLLVLGIVHAVMSVYY